MFQIICRDPIFLVFLNAQDVFTIWLLQCTQVLKYSLHFLIIFRFLEFIDIYTDQRNIILKSLLRRTTKENQAL